ncbi:MAG: putative 4-hydroxybenzoate polyprenyltransferase [Candidatus Magnetoovum sp. WYHC-5]|nr:putative 4-hydroxybenzoate polyprenyltransferase [Candidatus Magnetoovum sp. WYHC-5]
MKIKEKITNYMEMIKFSHSVFALPFALTAAILAANGLPQMNIMGWIILAMVSARTAAMGMNRIIDKDIDKLNPRTANRQLPRGVIKSRDALFFTLIASALFIFSAYMLNELCFKLSPVALLLFFIYPYAKRFTWLSHVILGLSIGLAPLGAWIAVTGLIDWRILLLVFAVLFWLAGFDIIYALQDLDFDKNHGLNSIPQRFGPQLALIISKGFHLLTWLLLVYTGMAFDLGIVYYIGILLVSVFLFYEHYLVRADRLDKINIAFFNMNGYISITIFVFVFIDRV